MTGISLVEYFARVNDRLPGEAARVLDALLEQGSMNKEELSLTAKVKRAVLDHVIMQLYALGLVDVSTEGKSKICSVTKLGGDFLTLIKAG
ncbi:transcriptional regulator [Desulfotomaculum copahuensis]|uniref:Transcriptional regulator n=1 Tax=Desulfotomaculum copahuensis TaxID=1838280 RepID=A0A1B7LGA7_9FIRM|nr:transcriptional regulator [Desulfotomaculum copahuensis]OAT85008.1 transcriptional regulator [Desulfotomaculum copahuensis]